MNLVIEVLVDIDPEQKVWVPQLAKSWELSEDGTRWTFQLVEGVEYHGGWGEFTAQDVLHSALTRDDLCWATPTTGGASIWMHRKSSAITR